MGKHSIKKDKIVRLNVKKYEFKRILLKYQLSNVNLNKKIKMIFHYKYLKNFHLNSSTSRIVNTCIHTGRSHWIIRRFKLSRMTFKKLADNGGLNGVRRATW